MKKRYRSHKKKYEMPVAVTDFILSDDSSVDVSVDVSGFTRWWESAEDKKAIVESLSAWTSQAPRAYMKVCMTWALRLYMYCACLGSIKNRTPTTGLVFGSSVRYHRPSLSGHPLRSPVRLQDLLGKHSA